MYDSKTWESVGVIVARFQVPELHDGHKYTVNYVLERHHDVLIILGVAAEETDHDPLSYEMRKDMIGTLYPDVGLRIIGSDSIPSSYDERSFKIDALIQQTFPNREVVVYGARDSFISTYTGRFSKALVPTVFSGSATEIRRNIVPTNSPDFRAGVIYARMNQKHFGYPTVDVAVIDHKMDRVLLVGKNAEEGKLRFPGVFFSPDLDESYEIAAMRCIAKETPSLVVGEPKIVRSLKLSDWRFRKSKGSIITLLVEVRYERGDPFAGKGVDLVR